MHLVIVTLVKLLRERTVLVRAVSEEGGRAYGDHGDDDEQDRPAGECDTFERRLDCVGNRHVIDEDAGRQGDDECDWASLVGRYLEHTQRDDEP